MRASVNRMTQDLCEELHLRIQRTEVRIQTTTFLVEITQHGLETRVAEVKD
jgi:hypothetical protein